MQHDTTLFVGIDAHQETLTIATLAADAQGPGPTRTIANRPDRIRAHFRRLLKQGSVIATYEAGCLGFVLHRQLTALGVQCVVAAPSKLPQIPGERRKTDKIDARKLAIFLRAGQIVEVNPPTPRIEALRTLTRTRQAIREDVVRARHRITKFTLHRGKVFRDAGNWTAAHFRWLRDLEFEVSDDRLTLDFLIDELENRLGALSMLDDRIERRCKEEDVRDEVAALIAFRGVKYLTALSVIAEIGDPRRFRTARQVGAYCGLVPSEHSSGPKVKRGGITRDGNARLRRLLVEATQHYARPFPNRSAVYRRRADAPLRAQRIALRADRRLKARYRHLAVRKHTNVAKCAIARELIGFLWSALHPDHN
jgi:transposase